jgi:hypothetical protein
MQTKLLNYRVIVEPETYPNGDKVYNAYCPTLGITDYGDTNSIGIKSRRP